MRLITRSDFDGLVCAMLFKKLGMIDGMKFVHPKDMQDGLIEVTSDDILANVPYVPGCGLWFDHHSSELERNGEQAEFEGEVRVAPSAARVVYDYYGGRERFGAGLDDIMAGVDKADAAQFSAQDILHPQGWDLLSFIMDARTGLGRYRDYRISNYQLMEELVDHCAHMGIEEILQLPDVQERVKRYWELDQEYRAMLAQYTRTDGNVIVTDLRNVETIYPGNRFMVYALYLDQNISIWVVDGRNKQNCVFACGHSIVNRTSQTNVGALMLEHGGGGHQAAGTCQIAYEQANEVLASLIETMKRNG
ncbi:nanoRNase/pAp phosphatase, hydrolyzes c-di-AMP and oligoRNAs [Paenibacillus sp. UNCCL117]|uniref:exopolyphosphatase n=1 Tax=unclassified Paenibacillus TaxID=185978 RepID=UPI0008891F10|nr:MULTISPECIES: exopolyphosphatase [unclassified Paenibacillus]SDC20491.1 nanoRNase/pAp phosphatase, hydrolyzes c-di-AMP and oligoRNAs [Paenibacillus sp. cl123]SFW18637.1 nanoRNase/pAp phosphatase, hydrolyzes c-di-AMP and oligoRNAs [Paenibacillus sp. UNCCL117]